MSVSPSGNVEEPVRPLDVSELARVEDSCAAAAGDAFTREEEEREYQDDDEVQCGARRPVKIQDRLPKRSANTRSLISRIVRGVRIVFGERASLCNTVN